MRLSCLLCIMGYNAAPKDTEISITKSQVILLGVFQKVGHGWSLESWDSKGDVLNRNASGWGYSSMNLQIPQELCGRYCVFFSQSTPC